MFMPINNFGVTIGQENMCGFKWLTDIIDKNIKVITHWILTCVVATCGLNALAHNTCSQVFESQRSSIERRLEKNDFTIDRPLLPPTDSVTKSTSQGITSYSDLFDSSFITYIQSRPMRVLDLGAGRGRAAETLFKLGNTVDGVLHTRPTHFNNNLFNKIFTGDILSTENPLHSQTLNSATYDAIVEAFGPSSYVHDNNQKTHSIETLYNLVWLKLKDGGRYYTSFDAKILLRNENRTPLMTINHTPAFGSGFQVVDGQGTDITLKWFRNIKGFKLLNDPSLPIQKFLELAFQKTEFEELNETHSLTFEKTHEVFYAPPLTQIKLMDGRPPIRKYICTEPLEESTNTP